MRYVWRLVGSRLALGVLTILFASFAIFWLVELLPGNAATAILGRGATAHQIATLSAQLHLGESPVHRYLTWLIAFLQGNWGVSIAAQRPVRQYVLPALRHSLLLAGTALVIYVPLSLGLGMLMAVLRQRRSIRFLSAFVVLTSAIPEFVFGIFFLIVFTVELPWFPPLANLQSGMSFGQYVHTLALPALTLAIVMSSYAARMMQANLVAVLDSEYVRMAVLKGLPRWRVVLRHAVPNALGPAMRVTVLNIAWVVGSIVLVENIFNYPGIGTLMVQSISLHDFPVVEAITLIMAVTYILANLAADVLAAVFDPRLRK